MKRLIPLVLLFLFFISFRAFSGTQKNSFDKESIELKPGITKHLIHIVSERGPVVANIIEVDLTNKNISIKVGLPHKKEIKSKDSLTSIVKTCMAYVGINANFFDLKIGNPLGTLITEGAWLIGPVYNRVAVGFTDDKKVLVDRVMLHGFAEVYRGLGKKAFSKFEIDGLNIPFQFYKKTGLFTTNWDVKLDLEENKKAIIVKDGCIEKITNETNLIPEDGYVLVSSKDYPLDYLKIGDCIKIDWHSEPNWSNVKEAISGGPYLIKDGEVYVDNDKQNFKFAQKDVYAPRTAIGIDYKGKLYLITVDGRQKDYSSGLTLKELAEFLKKLNLKDAFNLDGGGSTTLVVDGKIINKLSERHERKISNALLVVYKE